MKYHKDSVGKLTSTQEKILQEILQDWQAEYQNLPVEVTHGYELHSTHGVGDDGRKMVVGRNALFEKQAEIALKPKYSGKRQLRALYYPEATPSNELLHQTILYFDSIFILNPGSSVFENRRHPYGEKDSIELQEHKRAHAACCLSR